MQITSSRLGDLFVFQNPRKVYASHSLRRILGCADTMWGMRLKVTSKGQGCVAVWISDSIFWLSYFTPTLASRSNTLPKKVPKNYTKEKTATDKRRRRFFYTFLYLLGSSAIPWMREFSWMHWNGWTPQLRCQKYVNRFMHVFILIWYFGLP